MVAFRSLAAILPARNRVAASAEPLALNQPRRTSVGQQAPAISPASSASPDRAAQRTNPRHRASKNRNVAKPRGDFPNGPPCKGRPVILSAPRAHAPNNSPLCTLNPSGAWFIRVVRPEVFGDLVAKLEELTEGRAFDRHGVVSSRCQPFHLDVRTPTRQRCSWAARRLPLRSGLRT